MINKYLKNAAVKLMRAGIDTPALDAEVLLAHVLECERVDLVARRDESLTKEQGERFNVLIAKRAQRIPISQLTGIKEFWSLPIRVTDSVLTPRPETEGIVERSLKLFRPDESISILDIGTGSGCIAAALAHEFPKARLTVTDISVDALEVARKNLEFASERIEFLQGNLFDTVKYYQQPAGSDSCAGAAAPCSESLPAAKRKAYDLIVSNPPYIPDDDIGSLMREVRDHEPLIALQAGPDGLAIIRQIIEYAPDHQTKDGWLIIEIGMGQASAVKDLIEKRDVFGSIIIDKDLAGVERVVSAQRL